jgi:hypothetical protein
MSFEDIQSIWDTQSNDPLFTLDQTELNFAVRKRSRAISIQLNSLEIWGILLLVIVALITIQDDLMRGDFSNPVTYLTSCLMFVGSSYLIVRRVQRKQREQQFNATTRSTLEHSIAQLDYQMWFLKISNRVFNVVLIISMSLQYLNNPGGRPLWLYLAAAIMIPIMFLGIHRICSKRILPARQRLKSLLQKLIQNEGSQ